MTVGVVIPCRNMRPYLRQCVESASNQTQLPLYIVIIDGYSSDGSLDLALQLSDEYNARKSGPCSYMGVWPQQPRGMAAARNFGISFMQGCDWIIPLDADDWLEPNYIERCAAAVNDRTGIVAPALHRVGGGIEYPKQPITIEHMLRENCIFSCSMFRREAWEQVGGYDEHRRTYEDWDLWLRILKLGWEVVEVREPLYWYREHAASSSARMRPGDHEEYVRYIRQKHVI